MTGELSLIGKVLPVGGIKEKILAAKRAGITTIILPKLNQKDLAELPSYVLKDVKIHWVSQADEVFDLVLAPKQAHKKHVSKKRLVRALDRKKSEPHSSRNLMKQN